MRRAGNSRTLGAGPAGPPRRHQQCPAALSWFDNGADQHAAAHRLKKRQRAALPSIIVVDRGPAPEVGLALAELHQRLARERVSNVAVMHAAFRFFNEDEEAPLAQMTVDLAGQADAMGYHHQYHNAGHLREVTVNMANLAALNATRHAGVLLDKDDLILALALAVSHDLDHDGATNDVPVRDAAGDPIVDADGKTVMSNVPFLLEDKSIAAIIVAGKRAGVSEADLRRMRAVILITDPNTGYRILDAALNQHCEHGARAQLFSLRPELELLNQPATLRLAAMLRDADLLGSCGTSAAENDRETARLERERGLPPGGLHGCGTEYFMGTIARGKFLSPEGQFFQRNLEHLRALNFARLEAADPHVLTLADMEGRL